ncbi:hypothetical protein Bealeia1_01353 [Candidatus Bealeia paramacronuclearis]|uniref:Antibiotic biosynthesis monooxygenase n=1 Tax=Candidatus Bealeia paramacronuclearis TaxID=1921001 RepID=A0ABZ2C6D7_9PROT|nr:hypothetical protein [Candidatus Bealeia paramacronuclearis]
MYGMIVKWKNEKTSDDELIHDFDQIAEFSKKIGAVSTTLHYTKQKEFLIIQIWPSKRFYDAIFNERKFKYMERVPSDVQALLSKIEKYYKIEYAEEFKTIK